MAITRERLHEIIDLLLQERLQEAESALAPLLDPMGLALINAPDDDEETTEEDIRALEEARADHQRGEAVPLDDMMRALSESRKG